MVFLPQKLKKSKYARDGNITVEIKKTFIKMNKKFSTEVNTKITNKITFHVVRKECGIVV
jgi:hypothetical protein